MCVIVNGSTHADVPLSKGHFDIDLMVFSPWLFSIWKHLIEIWSFSSKVTKLMLLFSHFLSFFLFFFFFSPYIIYIEIYVDKPNLLFPLRKKLFQLIPFRPVYRKRPLTWQPYIPRFILLSVLEVDFLCYTSSNFNKFSTYSKTQ